MHWSSQVIAVAVCSMLHASAAVAQDARPRKVSQEHDERSNADFMASIDANGRAVFTVKAGDFLLEKTVDNTGAFTLRISQNNDVVTVIRDQQGYQVSRG